MMAKFWIKLYHELLDDPKMGRMSDNLWRRTIELFLLAGEIDEEGLLPPVNDIAWRLRITDDELTENIESLIEYNIVSRDGDQLIITKFAERQSAMTSAERSRRHRKQQQSDEYEQVHYETGNESETKAFTVKNQNQNNNNDDLFDECQIIYEAKKGKLVTDGQAFALMIQAFKREGVTASDYAAAIDAMDADGRYKGGKPTSYEQWAINYAKKRKSGKQRASKRTDPDHNASVIDKMIGGLPDE